MRVSFGLYSRAVLVFALSVALAAVGFGHRGEGGRMMDPAYAAFVAAGGSAQDLCDGHVADGVDSDHSKHETMQGCEACRLVDAVLVPVLRAPCIGWSAPRIVDVRPGTIDRAPQRTAHLLPQGRAPPRI